MLCLIDSCQIISDFVFLFAINDIFRNTYVEIFIKVIFLILNNNF